MAVLLTLSILVEDAATPPPAEAVTTSERAMRTLINRSRDAAGVRRLQFRTRLIRNARTHSQRMARAGSIFHNSSLGSQLDYTGWHVLGENVGVGATMRSLHNAFMNSPPHRANNLDSEYTEIGVGVVWARGRAWITVVFWG